MRSISERRAFAVKNVVSFVVSFVAVGFCFACTKPTADTKSDPSAASIASTKTPSAAAAKPTPAKADPTADYPSIAASCDTVKNLGECSEYAELGLLAGSVQSLCEGSNGTFSTSARCPKDGRIGMCSSDTKKTYFFKESLDLTSAADQAKFCKETMMGTWVDLAKAK
jgi:hypothetical protein